MHYSKLNVLVDVPYIIEASDDDDDDDEEDYNDGLSDEDEPEMQTVVERRPVVTSRTRDEAAKTTYTKPTFENPQKLVVSKQYTCLYLCFRCHIIKTAHM